MDLLDVLSISSAFDCIQKNPSGIPTIRITIHDVHTKEVPVTNDTIDDLIIFLNNIKNWNENNN